MLFAPGVRALTDPPPPRPTQPITRFDAPAGGSAWIVTDPELARTVLAHPQIRKDPALAPAGWTSVTAGLEPTAAEQLSVTTSDGGAHAALRRVFAPLFSPARMRAMQPRMRAIARELLAGLPDEVDLVADATTRYPLQVVGDLLGVPAERIETAIAACRLMHEEYPRHVGEAMAGFAELAGAATAAAELGERMPAGSTPGDLHYQIFTLLFAGQLTTDPTVGFLIARLLGDPEAPPDLDELVGDTLRRFPAAPFTLWRFTASEIELAGVTLPAHAPLLVDIAGINAAGINTAGINAAGVDAAGGDRADDLTFGAGPHFCIGAQLARLELLALAEVVRTDYPRARLAVPFSELRSALPGGIMGGRLVTLPVVLR